MSPSPHSLNHESTTVTHFCSRLSLHTHWSRWTAAVLSGPLQEVDGVIVFFQVQEGAGEDWLAREDWLAVPSPQAPGWPNKNSGQRCFVLFDRRYVLMSCSLVLLLLFSNSQV